MQFVFDAELFLWASRPESNVYFVAVPAEFADEIREVPRMPRGFGAVRVEAEVAGVRWRTSVFPSGGTYHLPVKRAVRDAARAGEGDTISVDLTVLEG